MTNARVRDAAGPCTAALGVCDLSRSTVDGQRCLLAEADQSRTCIGPC